MSIYLKNVKVIDGKINEQNARDDGKNAGGMKPLLTFAKDHNQPVP